MIIIVIHTYRNDLDIHLSGGNNINFLRFFFYITFTISQSARCHTGHLSDMMRSNAFCSHPIAGWSPIGGAHPPGLNPSNAKNSNLHFLAPSYFSPTGSHLSSPYFNF